MAREASRSSRIRDWLKSRYPEAGPLPNRQNSTTFCGKSGSTFAGNPKTSTYHRREASILVTGFVAPEASKHGDLDSQGGDNHLTWRKPDNSRRGCGTPAAMAGSWCSPSIAHPGGAGEAELQRRFRLEQVSFDDLLFNSLRKEAEALEIEWNVIEQADGADTSSQDWNNLLHLRHTGGTEGRCGPV